METTFLNAKKQTENVIKTTHEYIELLKNKLNYTENIDEEMYHLYLTANRQFYENYEQNYRNWFHYNNLSKWKKFKFKIKIFLTDIINKIVSFKITGIIK